MSLAARDPALKLGRPTVVRESWWRRGLVFGFVGFLGLVMVALSVMLFGMVRGEEFCPQTFDRRRFTYYQIPLLGLQVTPVFREDATGVLERKIAAVAQLRGGLMNKRWDLTMVFRAGITSWQGDADILRRYLDLPAVDLSPVWLSWTRDHPAMAGVLWPAVAELAQHQNYHLVPDLMELAASAENAADLQSAISQHLRRQYLKLAAVHRDLGDTAEAVQLESLAATHQTRRPQAPGRPVP